MRLSYGFRVNARPCLMLVTAGLGCVLFQSIFIAASTLTGLSTEALAQDQAAPPTPTPLPKTGVLARSSTFGYNTKMVDGAWGAGGNQEGSPPVSGSVSKISDREWTAKLFNNSEDTYSVSVEVTQLNAMGKRERSDSFSTRLGPQESNQRSLRATERTVDAELRLVSWRNLSEKKRQAAEAASKAAQAEAGAR